VSTVEEPGFSALTEFGLGSVRLDNRLAFLSTVNNLGANRRITDAQVAYYEARAEGGTGLIITEGMSVHPTSVPNGAVPFAFDPEMIPDLRRISDAVHRHDRAIYAQLWHAGRQALWNPGLQPWGVSGTRDSYSGSTPHVMSDGEVWQLVEGFAASARHLKEAGYDGAELHGAHGYLINQFLSPWSNQRTDHWGGSTRGRSRFLVEVVKAIRLACGDSFGIGLKLTADEYVEGGLEFDESCAAMDYVLSEVGLEFLAVSAANFSPSLEYHVADRRFPDAHLEHLARGMREVAAGRTAIMALCKIPNVETASRLIDSGACELVGMARALIADAAIVNKVRRGEAPRPCIFCNTCWEHIHTGRPAFCVYNPEASRELELRNRAAAAGTSENPLQIAVVGAGPAGLEYARVASERGHDVHVFEASDEVGGRFRRESQVTGLESYGSAVDWLDASARAAGARIETAAAADVPRVGFDLTVVATGANPLVTPIRGVETVSMEDALRNPAELKQPVVVIDEVEAEPVYAAVEMLVAHGLEVKLVTRRASIGRRVAYASMIGVFRRLDSLGVPIFNLLTPQSVEDGSLRAMHVFSRRPHDLGQVGTVVQAGPYVPNSATVQTPNARVIGDASAPRDALAVVLEAHLAALELPLTTTSSTRPTSTTDDLVSVPSRSTAKDSTR